MSMSTYIKGFIPPDEKWKNMKQVYDTCRKAGIEVPTEVSKFFNWDQPDDRGVEINLIEKKIATEWGTEMSSGYEIHIDSIPPDVKIIRFCNSW